MYGIPDFKLEKCARLAAHQADGGRRGRVPLQRECRRQCADDELRDDYDAIAADRRRDARPRSADSRPRICKGVHFAMEFLPQQNKGNQGDTFADQILATGKHVIVIGGGDTGSDCTGTSNRQGCRA